jgi:acetyl-CoA acyltransferase 2
MTILKGVYVVAAKRTAFGKFGGKLKDLSATDLQVIANKAAIEQSKLAADKIDSVVVGNILHVITFFVYQFLYLKIFIIIIE